METTVNGGMIQLQEHGKLYHYADWYATYHLGSPYNATDNYTKVVFGDIIYGPGHAWVEIGDYVYVQHGTFTE